MAEKEMSNFALRASGTKMAMRLRVVSSREEISNRDRNEKVFHLAFQASNADFLNLMQRCPRLRLFRFLHSIRKPCLMQLAYSCTCRA